MFANARPLLLRHSVGVLPRVGAQPLLPYRRTLSFASPLLRSSYNVGLFQKSPLRSIAPKIGFNQVLSRQYSTEKSDDDGNTNDGENQSGNAGAATGDPAESKSSAPAKVTAPAPVVLVSETKFPTHVHIVAYHRIYMPGQVTPFDPTSQTRDGEFIGFFLTKKNPLKPLIPTSIIFNARPSETDAKTTQETSHETSQATTKEGEKGEEKEGEKEESEEASKDTAASETAQDSTSELSETKTETPSETPESTSASSEESTKEKTESDSEVKPESAAESKTEDAAETKSEAAPEGKSDEAAADTKAEEKEGNTAQGAEEASKTEDSQASAKTEDSQAAKTEDAEAAKTEDSQAAKGEDSQDASAEKSTSSDSDDSSASSDDSSGSSLVRKRAEQETSMMDSTAVHDVGVLAQVDRKNASGPRLRFLLPIRLVGATARPTLAAKIEPYTSDPYDSHEVEELMNKVKKALTKAMEESPVPMKTATSEALLKHKEPNALVYGIMAEYSTYLAEAQAILSSRSVPHRLAIALAVVETDYAIRQQQKEISKKLEERTTKDQREFFLREQLKMVRKELGMERDEKEELIEKYRARLTGNVPKDAMKVIDDELAKLQMLEPSSSEYSITRNYLDWLTILPWGIYTKENFDLKHAREVLDEDHYGLKDIKTRILEFIAVGHLKGSVQGKIICLVGPPGVGKTSIGKSIARSLDRKFYRFSVGGMHDVSEIKGHRRTYVGAMPGKLLQCLKQVKTSNPVVLIDEIDKLGRGRAGDPASALLEVLDPEQNPTFMDHYLDVPVDLSKVLFICTANVKDQIPKPLLDRMEVMYLSGYIPEEQHQIVKNYLVPNALKESGLKENQIEIQDTAIHGLVKSYCREAGVRNLQKHVEKIVRKVALMRVRGTKKCVTIGESNLQTFVGKPVFTSDRYYEKTPPGIVMGLAWTQLGGAALYVETVQDPLSSRQEMRITGQLGEVMKESTAIAFTYSKNHLEVVSPGNRFFEGASLHMHIPEGATPKDGPSAGITMVTSLLSLALGQPILQNLAMTGELTLTGKVLPIGGVREKCIAAKRAGVNRIILPIGNKKDWTDLPENIKKGLDVHFADYYQDVYDVAFGDPKTFKTAKPEKTRTRSAPVKRSRASTSTSTPTSTTTPAKRKPGRPKTTTSPTSSTSSTTTPRTRTRRITSRSTTPRTRTAHRPVTRSTRQQATTKKTTAKKTTTKKTPKSKQ